MVEEIIILGRVCGRGTKNWASPGVLVVKDFVAHPDWRGESECVTAFYFEKGVCRQGPPQSPWQISTVSIFAASRDCPRADSLR